MDKDVASLKSMLAAGDEKDDANDARHEKDFLGFIHAFFARPGASDGGSLYYEDPFFSAKTLDDLAGNKEGVDKVLTFWGQGKTALARWTRVDLSRIHTVEEPITKRAKYDAVRVVSPGALSTQLAEGQTVPRARFQSLLSQAQQEGLDTSSLQVTPLSVSVEKLFSKGLFSDVAEITSHMHTVLASIYPSNNALQAMDHEAFGGYCLLKASAIADEQGRQQDLDVSDRAMLHFLSACLSNVGLSDVRHDFVKNGLFLPKEAAGWEWITHTNLCESAAATERPKAYAVYIMLQTVRRYAPKSYRLLCSALDRPEVLESWSGCDASVCLLQRICQVCQMILQQAVGLHSDASLQDLERFQFRVKQLRSTLAEVMGEHVLHGLAKVPIHYLERRLSMHSRCDVNRAMQLVDAFQFAESVPSALRNRLQQLLRDKPHIALSMIHRVQGAMEDTIIAIQVDWRNEKHKAPSVTFDQCAKSLLFTGDLDMLLAHQRCYAACPFMAHLESVCVAEDHSQSVGNHRYTLDAKRFEVAGDKEGYYQVVVCDARDGRLNDDLATALRQTLNHFIDHESDAWSTMDRLRCEASGDRQERACMEVRWHSQSGKPFKVEVLQNGAVIMITGDESMLKVHAACKTYGVLCAVLKQAMQTAFQQGYVEDAEHTYPYEYQDASSSLRP